MAEGDDAKTFRETLYVKKSLLAAVVVIQAFVLAVIGGGLWAWSNHAGAAVPAAQAGGAAQKSLQMATCTGRLGSTPDSYPFVIPLTSCDKAIDGLDVKAGFLSDLRVCGGADSFKISLNPRAVSVTSTAFNCSSSKTEATVTYIGYPAR